MSIASTNWAMEQRTDGPSAQSVLFVVADRANEHGVCRHADPDTIAQKTRQSRATVFRRLEELERAGVLTRFTRHLPDGRREYEVRLATTKFVNYRVDKERNIIMFAPADEDCANDPITVLPYGGDAATVESQSETHGESQSETGSVSPVRPDESQSCDPQESPSKNPSKKDSPQPPKGGEIDQADLDEAGQSAEIEGWTEFRQAWEADGVPIARVSIVKPLVASLTPDERLRLAKAAKGYLHHRSRERKPGTKLSAQNFVREIEAWDGWAKHAPPDIVPPTFIVENSRDHRALIVLALILNNPPPQVIFDVREGKRGFWRKIAVSPDLAGLAVFADKPVEQWNPIEKGTQPFGAWSQHIDKWTGRRPDPQRVLTGGEHPFEYNGQTTMIKNFVMGLRVPWLYPPLKDGSLSQATGPPQAA